MRSAIALMRSAIVVLPLLLWLVGCAPPGPGGRGGEEAWGGGLGLEVGAQPQAQGGGGGRAKEDAWSGRIALQVQAQAQAQGEGQGQAAQAFSAMFELHGNA